MLSSVNSKQEFIKLGHENQKLKICLKERDSELTLANSKYFETKNKYKSIKEKQKMLDEKIIEQKINGIMQNKDEKTAIQIENDRLKA